MIIRKELLKGLAVGLPIVGIAVAVVMVKTKPQAQRQKMPAMIPVVETATLQKTNTAVTVQAMGTVIADRAAAIQAQVSGEVIAMAPGLVEGALVRQGDLLLTIDRRDYEQAVIQAESALQTTRSALRLEEGSQAAARHEMDLVGTDADEEEALRDLMLREPQLRSAEAAVASAEAALFRARLNLERTAIRAPFDAVVKAVNADVGDYALSNKVLVELAASDRYFIRASLPVGALDMFPNLGNKTYSAEVTLTGGATRSGVLYKLLPDLSEQGRMARVLVAVENPLEPAFGRPMLLGEAVRVSLSGREVQEVYRIGRNHLRDGGVVWMIDPEDHLRICPAPMVQGYEHHALVRLEFSNDWKLVTSGIPAPVEGMKLNRSGAMKGAAQ